MPHLGAAYNFARWLVRHPQDAEDMVQEAYLKAYKSFDNFQGGEPLAWLLAILRNTCFTWLRRQKSRGKIIDFHDAVQRNELKYLGTSINDPTPAPDADLLASADKKRVQEAINELPEAYRMVVVLREFEDLKYAQISEILGVPIGTVMSRLSRARALMKISLTDVATGDKKNEL